MLVMAELIEIPVGPQKEYIAGIYAPALESTLADTPKCLAIMLHGFPNVYKQSHDDFYGDLETLFAHAGVHSFRFDFRGCGSSEGLQEDFTLESASEDMAAVLDWAEKQSFKEFIIVAEGLGAITALQNLRNTMKLGFLFWPVVLGKVHLDQYLLSEKHDVLNGQLIAELQTLDLSPILQNLSIPFLVQHPAEDARIGPEHMDYLHETVSSTRRFDITSYQDGAHGLPDERHRKMICFHMGQFLSKYMG